jgi:hypothetical protein
LRQGPSPTKSIGGGRAVTTSANADAEEVIEGRPGGRCYSEHTEGTSCQWGTILVWNLPHRFVLASQVGPGWQYEPDLAKWSVVEVRFTPSISKHRYSNATALDSRACERPDNSRQSPGRDYFDRNGLLGVAGAGLWQEHQKCAGPESGGESDHLRGFGDFAGLTLRGSSGDEHGLFGHQNCNTADA